MKFTDVAAGRFDFFHHLGGGPRIGPGPVPLPAQVVDHDPGAFPGEQQGLPPADAAPSPGDHRYLPFERAHRLPPPDIWIDPRANRNATRSGG